MTFFIATIDASFIVSNMSNINLSWSLLSLVRIKPNALLTKAMPTTFRPPRSPPIALHWSKLRDELSPRTL
jgi:hypothetical protein